MLSSSQQAPYSRRPTRGSVDRSLPPAGAAPCRPRARRAPRGPGNAAGWPREHDPHAGRHPPTTRPPAADGRGATPVRARRAPQRPPARRPRRRRLRGARAPHGRPGPRLHPVGGAARRPAAARPAHDAPGQLRRDRRGAAADGVPPGIRAAAAWAWRVIVAHRDRLLRRALRHLRTAPWSSSRCSIALLLAALLQPARPRCSSTAAGRARCGDPPCCPGLVGFGGLLYAGHRPVPQRAPPISPARSTAASARSRTGVINALPGLSQQPDRRRRRPTARRRWRTTGPADQRRPGPAGTLGEVITGAAADPLHAVLLHQGRPADLDLGVRLFPRQPRAYSPAPAAVLAHPDHLRAGDPRGRLRGRRRHRHRPGDPRRPLVLPLAALVFLGRSSRSSARPCPGWSPCWSPWCRRAPSRR